MIEYGKNKSLESLFYINENGLVCQEQWKDIPNYVGYYQASDLGRVKSLKRLVKRKNNSDLTVKEKILNLNYEKDFYYRITASKNGNKTETLKVHQLVAIIFLGHVPCGNKTHVDHINNIKTDNRVENLQIISNRENATKDRINKSGYTGVVSSKKRFRVGIGINKESIYLGTFDTKEEANNQYLKALNMHNKGVDVSEIKKIKRSAVYLVNIKGISKTKNGKFRVYDYVGGKYIHLGLYTDLVDAKKQLEKYMLNKKTTLSNG
jgi:hypothetical protein